MVYVYFGYYNEYTKGCFGGSYKIRLEESPKDLISFLETTVRKQFPGMEILQTEGSACSYTVFGVDPSKRINVIIYYNDSDASKSILFKEYF